MCGVAALPPGTGANTRARRFPQTPRAPPPLLGERAGVRAGVQSILVSPAGLRINGSAVSAASLRGLVQLSGGPSSRRDTRTMAQPRKLSGLGCSRMSLRDYGRRPGQGADAAQPGELQEGSRGSKRSETPGSATACVRIPEGCQKVAHARRRPFLAPRSGVQALRCFRPGVAATPRPPATLWQPSGLCA